MSITTMRRKFGRQMQILLWGIGIVFVAGIVLMVLPSSNMGPGPTAAKVVVATVNREPITQEAFEALFARQTASYQEMGGLGLPVIEIARGSLLQMMVVQMALAQDARAQGLGVSRGDLNRRLDQLVELQLKQSGREATAELRGLLKSNLQGQREAIRQGMMIEKLRQQVTAAVTVSDADLARSFRQVRARHILVAVQKGPPGKGLSPQQALAKAQSLLARIKGGADFAQVAKADSDDPGSALRGGELGWFGQGMMDPAFERAAMALAPGQVTDRPVRTQFGYHLIQVEQAKDQPPADLAKNRRKYLDQLREQRAGQVWGRYQQAVESKAQVEVSELELKGALALVHGNRDQAAGYFEQAVQKSEQLSRQLAAACYYNVATYYSEQGKWQQAIANYKQALDSTNTDFAQIMVSLGQAYAGLKDKATALGYYQKAATEEPDSYSTHSLLAQAYQDLGRADLAAPHRKWMADEAAKQAAEAAKAAAPAPLGAPGQPPGRPARP